MGTLAAPFWKPVRQSMGQSRVALGSIDTALLLHAKCLQHEGCGGEGKPTT
jgi:hypothetical protein